MNRCQICSTEKLNVLIDFGQQPLCNRFKTDPHEEEFRYPLILGQCQSCSLLQLTNSVPPEEIVPRVEWLKYNEPEAHLDDLTDVLCSMINPQKMTAACGITYKDTTMLRRLSEKGFRNTWIIDPRKDLGISQKGVASETILPLLTEKSVKDIADKHGRVDLIIARHILEHAPDTQGFLSAIWDMLNPDGYIVFEVPDCTKQLEFKDYSMPWEEHILYFVPETLKAFFNHTNYELVHYRKYPYITEDSQVAIVRKAKDKRITESKPISGIFALANEYANSYKQQRKRVCSYLKEYTAKFGKVAFYGAGHLSVMIINSLQIEGFIEFIADDTKQKQGKFLPGTSLEIKSSNALEKKNISLCILCLSPEHESKIKHRHKQYVNEGGKFLSIFPMQKHSLINDAMKDYLYEN